MEPTADTGEDQVANGANTSPVPKKRKTGNEISPGTSNASSETGTGDFQFSAETSLEKIRQLQAEFCRERDWDQYHSPRNVLLAMVGEVGEVAELFQWKGECTKGLPDWSEKEREDLGYELSDVLVYLVRLADRCHIDLSQAVLQKIEHNKKKYPADQVRGSSKKYTEYKQKQREESDR